MYAIAIMKEFKNKYFTHDVDMRNSLPIRVLRQKYRNDGYAVWCYMLEVLSSQTGELSVKIDEQFLKILAKDFCVNASRLKAIIKDMQELKLIKIQNGCLSCDELTLRFAAVDKLRSIRSEAGKKGAETRWKIEEENMAKPKQNYSKANAVPMQSKSNNIYPKKEKEKRVNSLWKK